MKDKFKNEVVVDDFVIFSNSNYSSVYHGRIIKITPKGVQLMSNEIGAIFKLEGEFVKYNTGTLL